ncbi:hypothetical protein BOTBODRAFT_187821 [Botryobasidium botryosum FD-172 SS1]|uniref:Uncharacterized protein n=1 Tax=Botryobasidium botryosum (strain FD-172 SS1) TaxID=930990 RepID=A0A067MRH4_BOTB1|nr:hypothetical protein BOTBODRAFT_187821 [Botryobasidium botryosum FD-172 SS1]
MSFFSPSTHSASRVLLRQRLVPSFSRPASCPQLALRSVSSSAPLSDRLRPAAGGAEEAGGRRRVRRQSREEDEDEGDGEVTYTQWLKTTGLQWKKPRNDGPNWLGGNVPFPLNPSFRPPPPLPSSVRKAIYNAHLVNPELNSVRALSQRYGISLKRVEAILRLKQLEETWKIGRPLQLDFEQTMEKCMGSVQANSMNVRAGREEALAADLTSDMAEGDGQRVQSRMYWESVAEGQDPIVPGLLQQSAERVASRQAGNTTEDGNKTVAPGSGAGRASHAFVDVGDRFRASRRDAKRASRV